MLRSSSQPKGFAGSVGARRRPMNGTESRIGGASAGRCVALSNFTLKRRNTRFAGLGWVRGRGEASDEVTVKRGIARGIGSMATQAFSTRSACAVPALGLPVHRGAAQPKRAACSHPAPAGGWVLNRAILGAGEEIPMSQITLAVGTAPARRLRRPAADRCGSILRSEAAAVTQHASHPGRKPSVTATNGRQAKAPLVTTSQLSVAGSPAAHVSTSSSHCNVSTRKAAK